MNTQPKVPGSPRKADELPTVPVLRLEVVINRNGHPKRVLKDVRSIMEISDEENETIKHISFFDFNPTLSTGKWVPFGPKDFDRITIEKRRS